MVTFALLIGVYAYGIYLLGIEGILTTSLVIIYSSLFFLVFYYTNRKYIFNKNLILQTFSLPVFFIVLFVLQCFVNVIGATGPEIAFDALWYHLTLPKLYLLHHSIFHIPGGLLYYSDMPKLGELLYIGALSFGSEINAKLTHYLFGLLSCLAIYKLSRKYFSAPIAFFAVVIFYSNLVVAWESITAYIDLIRTFFEIMSLYAFMEWFGSKKNKYLYYCALLVGLTIATKLIAVGSLLIYSVLIIFIFNKRIKNVWYLPLFWILAIATAVPWFLFAYIYTGNPVYPFLTNLYPSTFPPLNIFIFFKDVLELFIQSSDPISPMYLIIMPLVVIFYTKFSKDIKIIIFYSLLSIIIWYFTPHTGGGRFMLPYLPAFSIVCAAVIDYVYKRNLTFYYNVLVGVMVIISVLTLGYRSIANSRYIPYIVGKESKSEFLTHNLNFAYGDFYDIDEYFKNTITTKDTVLLYGFHNLYYVDFPFIDATWVQKGDTFNYIAIQNTQLPIRFKEWKLIYENNKTLVKLYEPPQAGACRKICTY